MSGAVTHVVLLEVWGGAVGYRRRYLKKADAIQTFDDRLDAMNAIDEFYRRMMDNGIKANATIERVDEDEFARLVDPN